MLCPSCGQENPSDAQFCNGCSANIDIGMAEVPKSEDPLIGHPYGYSGQRAESSPFLIR